METTIESKRPRALYINNALAIYVYVAIISVGYLGQPGSPVISVSEALDSILSIILLLNLFE